MNFRKGPHGLAAPAGEVLGEDPFPGPVLALRSKRADRIKLLVWDGGGLVLVWKRLPQDSLLWPPVMNGVMRLFAIEFAGLFDGLD